MILLFELIAITSIWCLGLTILTQHGMALYFIRVWANKKGAWFEPLIRCHWCMPSIHTAIGILFALGIGVLHSLTWNLLFYYPIIAMCSSLINGLVWGYHLKTEAQTDYYESARITQDLMADEIVGNFEDKESEKEYFENLTN